jgi:hypothetical protein
MEKIEIETLCFKMIELLDNNYVITSTKSKILDGIRKKLNNGDYNSLTNYDAFASLLTN